ncbi:hypothetical protein EDC22_107178 [Tepidamorphus gemmatus]|jgi:hypothetical protein|uniref:Uncharacterized protein n=1 Tax=Tepidamorphus gemmatus TaxID=747076 RepID=A0A4R3M7L2_9HYPH|nr:hypothetical protein [Tepidamorphus gemmatus]TCT09330.1 hypothetical protein EDC22_107178 [Tepidamorphus gemmatus]
MSLVRDAIRSSRGKVAIGVVVALVGWQAWLSATASAKIAEGIDQDRRRVDVLVTLRFPPERFHIQKFQKLGRVSGTSGNSVQVRGVNKADLTALARPFWVERIEPLQ